MQGSTVILYLAIAIKHSNMENYVKCNFSVTHFYQKSINCHLLSSFDITCPHNSSNLLSCERLMLAQCVWPQNWKPNVKMGGFLQEFKKILVDILLCCGLEQHFTGHILLLSVYNCAGLSLGGPKRRAKQEKDTVMSTSHKLRNWVLENHPLNLPLFYCTVLYKNVLNVLVLGTFL